MTPEEIERVFDIVMDDPPHYCPSGPCYGGGRIDRDVLRRSITEALSYRVVWADTLEDVDSHRPGMATLEEAISCRDYNVSRWEETEDTIVIVEAQIKWRTLPSRVVT